MFLNASNEADGNLYVGMPPRLPRLRRGDAKQYVDLAAWRSAHGWDKNRVVADAQIDFDPDTLQLTITSRQPLPAVSPVNQIDVDILGKETGPSERLARWPTRARSRNGRLTLAPQGSEASASSLSEGCYGYGVRGTRDRVIPRRRLGNDGLSGRRSGSQLFEPV